MFILTVDCRHCKTKGTCLAVKVPGLLKRARYSCIRCLESYGYPIDSAKVVPCSICKGVGEITRERFRQLYNGEHQPDSKQVTEDKLASSKEHKQLDKGEDSTEK